MKRRKERIYILILRVGSKYAKSDKEIKELVNKILLGEIKAKK